MLSFCCRMLARYKCANCQKQWKFDDFFGWRKIVKNWCVFVPPDQSKAVFVYACKTERKKNMYIGTMSSLKEQIIEKVGVMSDADNDEIAKLFEGV